MASITQEQSPAVGEVPPGDFAGAKRRGGEHLDRVVRREVVAEKEEAVVRDDQRGNDGESGSNCRAAKRHGFRVVEP